jgi:hypothetical protein
MDAEQATSLVVERIRSQGLDYPTQDLTAAQFDGGWCVYAPEMITEADVDPRAVFLVGVSGRIEEVTSSAPLEEACEWFMESCIWFSALEPDRSPDSGLPSAPDFTVHVPPRTTTDYDRAAIDALARGLTHERDFSGWLADRLGELADLLGGSSRLIARRPNGWAADQVRSLAETNESYDTGVWQTWPAIDPARLPEVDTTGWLLTPLVAACEYLESLESESPAASRLADAVAARAEQAPSWLACNVAELMPQLVALRRSDQLDADLTTLRQATEDGDILDRVLMSPSDADVEALLRLAIDTESQQREYIEIDAAATAAYRRILDRLDLFFENYGLEAMFE